ncbi:hypothetical protein VTI74DRAFT_10618 [Chaetomium olivicolor]
MNTPAAAPHTPLEKLFLFQAVARAGLEDSDFARISDILQNNKLLKQETTYDARRLTPDILRELFLRILREELRAESENKLGPDGSLSPSKKRRLESPPLLTLKDARQHIAKIESAHAKLYNAYIQHAINEIRQFENQYERLEREIADLVKQGVREPESEQKPQSPVVAPQEAAVRREAGPVNGVGPSLGASPRPAPQVPVPHGVPQQPLRPLQPLLPHPRQEIRNGPPLPQSATAEKASSASISPAPGFPEIVRSPQLAQQEPPRAAPISRPTATPKPPNGTPPVLQAPQGVPPYQPPSQSPVPPAATEGGLQRPEGVVGPGRPPVPPPANAQLPPQGQLKWEPPYQPNAPPPRQAPANVPHTPSNAPTPPPHAVPSPRPSQQQPPHPSPAHMQAQGGRPLPQQAVLIPPHSTSPFAPPLQSPQLRSPAEGAPAVNRPQHIIPSPAASTSQPQSPFHPPPYQGYPIPTSGQVAPVPVTHPPPAPQPHPPSVHPGPARSPAPPPPTVPPATTEPRPSHGLAAPQQRQPPALQAPPYSQPPALQGIPSPTPTQPDGAQRYNSPYQPPRPAAVERIHPRLPAAATPTPAARFSHIPSAPQTPAMTLPPRISGGSGTKWVSTSTPSTPKPGLELRLGYDDVPSPAFEPTSPVLQPSVPPARPKTMQKPGDVTAEKQKPGRPPVPQRDQPTPVTQAKQAQGAGEEAPRVKDEVTTPRPSTETGDTTADESVTGRAQPLRSTKRKRDDLTPTPTPIQIRHALPEGLVSSSEGPKVVLWTRSFNKVCGSAMEQIVHHRSANMFAQPIREKDAPGYHKVVKQPQDLKSIRAAINHGNRAAAQAAAALPDGGDPGTSSVWLPRTEDLVPPRSIINSSQLDRELAHMFSNAIMYNPDPHHGPGSAFLRDVDEEDEEDDHHGHGHGHQDSGVLGYKVDEFGVVKDARAMFVEVEKLLSELRSAEIQRNVPAPAAGLVMTGTSTRQTSVLGGQGGAESVKDDGGGDGEEGEEEGEEGEKGAVKRRRIVRG